MKKYFVFSALGKDRPGIVNQMSKAILDCGCNIEDSRMTVLGGEFALILMVSGHWGAITRLERQLPPLEQKLELTILSKHTEPRASVQDRVPYTVDVVAMDLPRGAYRHAHVLAQPDGEHPGRRAHRPPARRVHGFLRQPQSRRHHRAGAALRSQKL